MQKVFYQRPLTGTGKTAARVNSDFDEQRERIRGRVRVHIAKSNIEDAVCRAAMALKAMRKFCVVH